MGKKSRRPHREKQIIGVRTKEERQEEVQIIMNTLTQFELTTEYAEVRQLIELLQSYIENGERIVVNIPFPKINRCIQGILAISKREKVWIRLKQQKY